VTLAGPVVAAASEIVYVLMIVVAVLVSAGAAGAVGVLIWRWHHPRPIAVRAVQAPKSVGAAQPLPEPPRAIEPGGQLHLHFHGVTAEDVAEILRRELP
jgi:hypothetical protein